MCVTNQHLCVSRIKSFAVWRELGSRTPPLIPEFFISNMNEDSFICVSRTESFICVSRTECFTMCREFTSHLRCFPSPLYVCHELSHMCGMTQSKLRHTYEWGFIDVTHIQDSRRIGGVIWVRDGLSSWHTYEWVLIHVIHIKDSGSRGGLTWVPFQALARVSKSPLTWSCIKLG